MTQATRACAHCGQQHQRTRAKYCTDLCARRAYTKARTADGRLAAARNSPEAKAKLKAWKQANTERYKVERTCTVCGARWMTQRKDAKYCTPECYVRGTQKPRANPAPRTPPRVKAAQRQIERAARGTAGTKWAAGSCRRCGTAFVCAITGTPGAYCSIQCLRLDSRDRRRARKKAAFVEPVFRQQVYERDAWTCYLCGDPLDRTAHWSEPKAPTIDHVIALANGGPHSMINVRAAHRLCNSIKSDRQPAQVTGG